MDNTRTTSIAHHSIFPHPPQAAYISPLTKDHTHLMFQDNRPRASLEQSKLPKSRSKYHLRKYAEQTLGEGSLRKAVMLPEGEDLDEWLAVNGMLHALGCLVELT